jgi:intracellular sulfur oxidation DsrE/DsrF family protein
MNNHLSVYDFDTLRVKLVLVTHGAGVKFFLDDLSGTPWAKDEINPDLYKRFTALSKFGVEAYLCQITFKRNNIDLGKAKKDSFLKFVPSGVATVAELQRKGFAYLKVG